MQRTSNEQQVVTDSNDSTDSTDERTPNSKRDTPLVETDGDGWDEKRIDTIAPNGNEGLHYEEGTQ